MSANQVSNFIDGDRLTAIVYTTAERPEAIHPQVMMGDDGWYVYGRAGDAKKRRIPMGDFARHVAMGTKGLAVRGIRPSDGRATSISFSQTDRLSISAEFLAWARTHAS